MRAYQETYLALQKLGLEFPPPSRQLMEESSRLNARRIEQAEEQVTSCLVQ